MHIAFVGAEGSLKDVVAQDIFQTCGIKPFRPDHISIIDRMGMDKNVISNPPERIMELLDEMVEEHSSHIKNNSSGIHLFTSIDALSYFFYYCPDINKDTARDVYKNALYFTRNYDKIFLFTLKKNNYDMSDKPFASVLAREYAYEMLMRGIMQRWNIPFINIDDDTLESASAAVSIRLEGVL